MQILHFIPHVVCLIQKMALEYTKLRVAFVKYVGKKIEPVALGQAQCIVLNIKVPHREIDNGRVLLDEVFIRREALVMKDQMVVAL